jgi:phage-related protein
MSVCISATVLESVWQLVYQVQYLLLCQVLWVPLCIETTVAICYVLYAGCHMPRLICQFLYVEYHMLAAASLQSYQFICQSQYQLLYVLCQISHDSYSIPAFICRHMSAKSFMWVAKLVYMSITSIICQMLWAICQTPYARLQYAKCYAIAMSFSMTTEQVGHLIIYIYYPAMTLHIAVTEKRSLLYQYGINLNLRS